MRTILMLAGFFASSPAAFALTELCWNSSLGSNSSVTADIQASVEIQTPWGSVVEEWFGKLARKGDQLCRIDRSDSYSEIYDRGKLTIVLDHVLHTAVIRPTAGLPLVTFLPDRGMKGTLEGRELQGARRVLTSGGGAPANYMLWQDKKTGVLVERHDSLYSNQLIFNYKLRHLREEEPDPALFRIPDGYAVTNCENPKDVPMCGSPSSFQTGIAPPVDKGRSK